MWKEKICEIKTCMRFWGKVQDIQHWPESTMSLKANALPLCWRADNTDFIFVSKHKNN